MYRSHLRAVVGDFSSDTSRSCLIRNRCGFRWEFYSPFFSPPPSSLLFSLPLPLLFPLPIPTHAHAHEKEITREATLAWIRRDPPTPTTPHTTTQFTSISQNTLTNPQHRSQPQPHATAFYPFHLTCSCAHLLMCSLAHLMDLSILSLLRVSRLKSLQSSLSKTCP